MLIGGAESGMSSRASNRRNQLSKMHRREQGADPVAAELPTYARSAGFTCSDPDSSCIMTAICEMQHGRVEVHFTGLAGASGVSAATHNGERRRVKLSSVRVDSVVEAAGRCHHSGMQEGIPGA